MKVKEYNPVTVDQQTPEIKCFEYCQFQNFGPRLRQTSDTPVRLTLTMFLRLKSNTHHIFIIYSQYNLYGLSKYLELVDGMSTARQEHLSNDIEFFPIPSSNILLKFATELIVKIAKAFFIGSHTVQILRGTVWE